MEKRTGLLNVPKRTLLTGEEIPTVGFWMFGSNKYSAGFCGYLWSDLIPAWLMCLYAAADRKVCAEKGGNHYGDDDRCDFTGKQHGRIQRV